MNIKPLADRVLILPAPAEVEGTKYLIMRQSDVLAVLG